MSYYFYETYPKYTERGRTTPYYVEFSQWNRDTPRVYRVFKRYWLVDAETEERKKKENAFFMAEGHPFNLLSGEVLENNDATALDNESGLKFMVDALNYYANNKKNE